MKAFWDNYFFDLDESGLTKEEFAAKAGAEVRDSLDRIETAIRMFDLQKAFKLIEAAKSEY